MGVFWPCPTLDHPGTPRLFEGGSFFHPDGKAASCHGVARERRSGGRAISVYLTTGRVVSQYLSGTQTRRIGALVDQYPEPAGDSSAAGGAAWNRRRGLGDDHDAARRDHAAGAWWCGRSGRTRSSFRTTGRASAARTS